MREAGGETIIESSVIDRLDATSEISKCSDIFENLSETIQQPNFNASTRLDCQSQLLHLISRIKHIKPVLPEERAVAYQLMEATEAQLIVFAQPNLCVECQKQGGSNSTEISQSPLADIIERI